MRISDWSSDVCSSDLGLYRSADGRLFEDVQRQRTTGGSWDPVDEEGRPLTPLPTPESKRPALASVYAINTYVQERSEERRVGKECVSACRCRWSPSH